MKVEGFFFGRTYLIIFLLWYCTFQFLSESYSYFRENFPKLAIRYVAFGKRNFHRLKLQLTKYLL